MEIHLGPFYIGVIIGLLLAYLSIRMGGDKFKWPDKWFNVIIVFNIFFLGMLFIDEYVTPISYAIVI